MILLQGIVRYVMFVLAPRATQESGLTMTTNEFLKPLQELLQDPLKQPLEEALKALRIP